MRALVLIPALLATAALAADRPSGPERRQAERVERIMAGRTAGQPTNCLPMLRNLNSERTPEGNIIYSRGRSATSEQTVWLNKPYGGCAPGRNDVAMVTQRPQNQACRGDIVQLFDPVTRIPYGACSLGDFVPYTRAK